PASGRSHTARHGAGATQCRAGGDGQAGTLRPGPAGARTWLDPGPRHWGPPGCFGPRRSASPDIRAREGALLKVHLGLPSSPIGPVTLTVGSFDGVHLGHVDVIGRTVGAAAEINGASALITFEPHPRCVLDPANCPQSITTLQEKLALIERAGIANAIVLRFDRELSALSPQDFIDRLSAAMETRRWVIGFDFAFGRGRTGNAEWLRSHGHAVEVIPPLTIDGRELHSSEVR